MIEMDPTLKLAIWTDDNDEAQHSIQHKGITPKEAKQMMHKLDDLRYTFLQIYKRQCRELEANE